MNLSVVNDYIQPTTVIDIGANVGHWYQEAKALWPQAKYFLIEGNDECRPALEALGVDFRIALLSDTEREVEFFTMKDCGTATGCSYYRENTPFFEGDKAVSHKVQTQILDKLVAEATIPDCDGLLIKIDCQGAELDILKGGAALVSCARALILELSHFEYNAGAPSADEVMVYLAEHGFERRAKLEDVIHPLQRELIIQTTVLFTR